MFEYLELYQFCLILFEKFYLNSYFCPIRFHCCWSLQYMNYISDFDRNYLLWHYYYVGSPIFKFPLVLKFLKDCNFIIIYIFQDFSHNFPFLFEESFPGWLLFIFIFIISLLNLRIIFSQMNQESPKILFHFPLRRMMRLSGRVLVFSLVFHAHLFTFK